MIKTAKEEIEIFDETKIKKIRDIYYILITISIFIMVISVILNIFLHVLIFNIYIPLIICCIIFNIYIILKKHKLEPIDNLTLKSLSDYISNVNNKECTELFNQALSKGYITHQEFFNFMNFMIKIERIKLA